MSSGKRLKVYYLKSAFSITNYPLIEENPDFEFCGIIPKSIQLLHID